MTPYANAAFALAHDCTVMDAFALAFSFDSSAFEFALAFGSNAKQVRIKCHCITAVLWFLSYNVSFLS